MTHRYLNAYTTDSNGVSRKQALQVKDASFYQKIFNSTGNGSNSKKVVLEELLASTEDSAVQKAIQAQIDTLGSRMITADHLETLAKKDLVKMVAAMELTVGGSFTPSVEAVATATPEDDEIPF